MLNECEDHAQCKLRLLLAAGSCWYWFSSFVILPPFLLLPKPPIPRRLHSLAPSLPDAGVSRFARLWRAGAGHRHFSRRRLAFQKLAALAVKRGRAPKMNVLETRSLGGRHALLVVGYEQERFLIASSPGGVNLLSHLPGACGRRSAGSWKSPRSIVCTGAGADAERQMNGNIQHPTSDIQRPTGCGRGFPENWLFDVGCWMLVVFPASSPLAAGALYFFDCRRICCSSANGTDQFGFQSRPRADFPRRRQRPAGRGHGHQGSVRRSRC